MVTIAGSVVLEQVRILDPEQGVDQRGNIWVAGGRLKGVLQWQEQVPAETQRLRGENWVVGPGLVDLYAHSGEPGFEERETLSSLAQAALAGGFTQVGLLPSTDPAVDSWADLEGLRSRSQALMGPRWLPLAAITQGNRGKRLTELWELSQGGIAGFCGDHPLPRASFMQKILDGLVGLQTPILVWPWQAQIAGEGVIYEGEWALRLGLPGLPSTAETSGVAQVLEFARRSAVPIHLMRITQGRSLELIRAAQQEGVEVTASATWMHLILSEADIEGWGYDPNLRLQPPLASASDRAALIRGLQSGILTAVATDHSPYTFEEKAVPFGEAPAGGIGLELALPLLWSHLVQTEQISALQLWSRLTQGPAHCLGLPSPRLTVGSPANLILFDPTQVWKVERQSMRSLSAATPWWGQEIQGKVIQCWVPGLNFSL